MKRIAIHILIVLILCGVFCDGYFTVSQLSCGWVWLSDSEVFAADSWEDVTRDDLVTAFQYYCKSRNLTIDGSIADALTSFTTTTFNNICNVLGIDVTFLQANLKKTVEGNLGLRFLMNQQGVLAYNRIFAEFLQNNDLVVGDIVDNKTVFNGKSFTDDNGNSCLIYIISSVRSNTGTWSSNPIANLLTRGSYLKYSNNSLSNGSVVEFNINGRTYSSTVNYLTGSNAVSNISYGNGLSIGDGYYFFSGDTVEEGCLTVYYVQDQNKYYIGSIGVRNNSVYSSYQNTFSLAAINSISITDSDIDNADVYITTNNNTINNNNYSNNYTIIYNDGDYYEDDDEPAPNTPPSGGGGGGDDPDQPSPSGPDLPDWNTPHGTGTIGSDGTFDFDIPFSLPDLNIDWSLKNIGNKFPFCIPSDIVSFYQVLAVEPEAPSIDAHIPLGSFYDWHFEADFSQYDNWARIIRIVEYVGFVITLIYFTVKLVKG